MAADRRAAWAAYVGATRNVVDAANAAGAHVVLVSTDWVFDGTQAPATEDAPPNPVNQYGFLKAASELVVAERAERGTVARIAGVQGAHRARPAAPRRQDAGFGYFVASLVDALRARRAVHGLGGRAASTCVATPTLATDAGELIWRALEREATGILHCCGGEHADRVDARAPRRGGVRARSRRSCAPARRRRRRPRRSRTTRGSTRRATAPALGVELPDLDAQLARLRQSWRRRRGPST